MQNISENKVFHLTADGLQKYKAEFKKLKEELKKKKTRFKETRDELWRPEDLNPDYEALESEIISIEMRLKELENILKNAKIIRKSKQSIPKIVTIGTTVVLEVDRQTDEFIIVESLEANPAEGKISNESPVGKALLGRKKGEVVTVQSAIKATYKILNIKYDQGK